MTIFTYRLARPDDWKIIGDLHAANWRSEYAGILPDSYLQNDVVRDRHAHWKKALGEDNGKNIFVLAFDGNALAGFAAVVSGLDAQADATLDNLHVAEAMRGGGLGRQLLAQATSRLIAKGATSLCLWAFDNNPRAIAFYKRLGARKTAEGFDPMHGANAPHTQLTWHDLDALLAACKKENRR